MCSATPPNPATFAALLCSDGREYLACREDSLDHAYAASHEIAHSRCGHVHTEALAVEQARVLARWCRRLGAKTVLTCTDGNLPRVEFGPRRCDRCNRPATIFVASLARTLKAAACTRCAGMVILELREAGFGRFVYEPVDAA